MMAPQKDFIINLRNFPNRIHGRTSDGIPTKILNKIYRKTSDEIHRETSNGILGRNSEANSPWNL